MSSQNPYILPAEMSGFYPSFSEALSRHVSHITAERIIHHLKADSRWHLIGFSVDGERQEWAFKPEERVSASLPVPRLTVAGTPDFPRQVQSAALSLAVIERWPHEVAVRLELPADLRGPQP